MSARRPIRVLQNAAAVVELLAEEGALGPAELAEQLGIPRPSVYRLLDGLAAIGFTEPTADAGARLDRSLMRLADSARAAMTEWRGGHEVLVDVVGRTRQTAYLTVRRGDDAVCIDWEQGRGVGVLMLKPGRALPLNAGAAGRAFLAFEPDGDAWAGRAGHVSYTPQTLTDPADLRADAAATRERGYALSDEDVTIGIGAIAAPIFGAGGQLVGCLSLAGVAEEFRTRRHELADEVRAAAAALGERHRSAAG
ncbi:IclR family transcriptional regulator [Microbacterium gilvum]|uniref:IclR family transcriptional regulator n=1 Tax=Microbacterium gilvum TaxID=1336204 RepID=A0ABP9A122_9MICO